jgi:pimeloyl-ACP methyl ester carboxylesterase
MQQLVRNGIKLTYEEVGDGEPPILLVHGGMADHRHFTPQLTYFGKNRRTVAVDLRGHGKSDKPEQAYTIEGFREDVAWLCEELHLHQPVVVGHSMGGLIALDLAAKHPAIPSAIVILDSPVVPPSWLKEALGPFAEALRTAEYRPAIRKFLTPFMGFAKAPDNRERMLAEMSSCSQHVVASALEHYVAYDSAASASACRVPILYISSGPWFSDIERFRQLCPQLTTGQTVGSGHYHQLEVPEQINSMITRFLTASGIDGGS